MPLLKNISGDGRAAQGIGVFTKDEVREVTEEQARMFADNVNFAVVSAAPAETTDANDSESADDADDAPRSKARTSKKSSNA